MSSNYSFDPHFTTYGPKFKHAFNELLAADGGYNGALDDVEVLEFNVGFRKQVRLATYLAWNEDTARKTKMPESVKDWDYIYSLKISDAVTYFTEAGTIMDLLERAGGDIEDLAY